MERNETRLTPLDELFLERACELARRGLGNTAPNPPVGAVVARGARIVGEGHHRVAGAAHAEADALRRAGADARGSTLYVSLEPCRHVGRTPPCTDALVEAGVAKVVAGALDPSGNGGAAQLRERGIEVVIAQNPAAADLIEKFSTAARCGRPYLAVKMAMSLDGAVAREPGVPERLGSEAERRYVRDLRCAFDAVLVGAGTVRIDDPQLTVRPPHDRSRPYARIVACQTGPLPASARVFAAEDNYLRTIVLAPAGARQFAELRDVAEVIAVGDPDAQTLDLAEAMQRLKERGICSVLCEGGPKLAASLIAGGLVDRFHWAIAPVLLHNERAVPVLAGADLAAARLQFDRLERIGDDVVLSGRFSGV